MLTLVTLPYDENPSKPTPALLAREQALTFATETAPDEVTVTGYTGSGYPSFIEAMGADRYAGHGLGDPDATYVVVMRQHLKPEVAMEMERLGLTDAFEKVRSLEFGTAYLITRPVQSATTPASRS